MKRIIIVAVALALGAKSALVYAQTPAAPSAPAAKPTIPQVCLNCHQAKPGNIQGLFENVAFKSKSIQLKIDANTEIVRFDEGTIKVVDVDKAGKGDMLRDIAKGREARIEFVEKDGVKNATLISFKGPIKIAPEKVVGYSEVLAMVEQGPEKSNAVLIDSRPLPRFQEGTIPGAINLPYPAFDKFVDRLPKDKATRIVFFCQGVTCMMSPNSLRRAEGMGYTNVRVYPEGAPEWLEKNVGVISAPFLKEAWIDKDIPHVLLDVRALTDAKNGFIASHFQRHFLLLGLQGGGIGGGAAIVLFALAGGISRWFTDTAGGDQATAMFGSFSIGMIGYVAVLGQVILIAAVTAMTSRQTVNRTLEMID